MTIGAVTPNAALISATYHLIEAEALPLFAIRTMTARRFVFKLSR